MPYAFLLYAFLVASASAASVKNLPNKKQPQPSTDGDISLLNPTAVNGTNLYETDILLTDEQHLQVIGKKAINNLAARWPTAANGFPEVPYRFGDANVDKAAVAAGIAHWEGSTCIKFRLDESQTSPHIKFILGSGCWSYIGRINSNTGQDLSIGTGCTGSPAGTKINLTSSKLVVQSCSTEGVLVNKDGDSSYPNATTSGVCGMSVTIQATSNGNRMAVMFYSNNAKSSMSATATIVAA